MSDPQLANWTSRLMDPELDPPNPRGLLEAGKYGEYMASFRCSVLALFGPPLYASDIADESYEYIIEATDRSNKTWILTVYHGAGGPAIGGDSSDDSILPPAKALWKLIQNTKPADFEATVYDDDTDNTVTYGCKDGHSYWNETRGNHLSP